MSNGDSYNTMLDGDVCYDDYGLPYIPAKRIKGCLREAANEICMYGKLTGKKEFCIDTERLFGLGDSGVLILSNARLTETIDGKDLHYEDFVSDLKMAKKELQSFHQQQVVSAFTYIRKMTSIDKNGAAKETSLRTLRVLRKGLVFEADISLDFSTDKSKVAGQLDEDAKKIKEELELCCKAFRRMGIHRTRGLGEISVSLDGTLKINYAFSENGKITEKGGDSVKRLEYTFKLKAPVVVKNIEKGDTKTQDYLDGSKIIGVLSKRIPQNLLRSILNDPDTIFSNAYISDENGNRYTPVPASFCEYKDSTSDEFIDRVSVTDDNRDKIENQLSALDHFYVFREDPSTYFYKKKNVFTQIRYHHAKSADKGTGSVGTDGAFYQVQSICEGQSFKGFICAKEKYLEQIEKALSCEKNCQIGNLKNAEYGFVWLSVEPNNNENNNENENRNENKNENKNTPDKRFAVKLISPVILYNQYGMYSTDENDFKNQISCLLENIDLKLDSSYKKYAMVGGFNSTWKMPKPVLSVLGKGSVFIFESDTATLDKIKEENIKTVHFIGERTVEGYGEIEFYPALEDFQGYLESEKSDSDDKQTIEYRTPMIPNLAEMLLKNHCKVFGMSAANEYYGNSQENLQDDMILNVTNQLLYSMQNGDSIKTLNKNADNYKIEEKKTIAKELLEQAAVCVTKVKSEPAMEWAIKQYRKDNRMLEDFLNKECYGAMLEHLKYKCVKSVKEKRKGASDGRI